MAIPDYETLMLPVLQAVADGAEHRSRDLVRPIAEQFHLSEDDRKTLIPSGTESTLSNRVGWARKYLKAAGLLRSPQRGVIQITDEGQKVLKEGHSKITSKLLMRYPSFVEFKAKKKPKAEGTDEPDVVVETDDDQTPDDRIQAAYDELRSALADEILDRVRSCSPQFFERLVVELLVAMGYGGSREDAGKAVGRSGDEGIDGTIKEDKLGLDVVYIQAKRWQDTVGRPKVQEFAGSMSGFRAKKGVFVTTSTFSREARDYVEKAEQKIVLIDGSQLAEFMIDHNVGVSPDRKYEIKRIDSDYFDDDGE